MLSDDDKFPLLALNAREEIQREIDYVLKGLDKLYFQSTSLTREQVKASSDKSEARVVKKVTAAKERAEKIKAKWADEGKPIVREAMDSVDAVLGKDWEALKEQMSWLDGVTTKDWTKFNSLKQAQDTWDNKFMALHGGETKDKALNAKDANIVNSIATLRTELSDVLEGFKDRLSLVRKTAYDRIEAREAIASESSQSSSASSSPSKSARSRVSILPIEEETASAKVIGADIIGKGKEQVMEAMSMAEAARASLAADAKAGVDDAASAVSSVVENANKSAKSVVAGTPSPSAAAEYLESIAADVKQGYASVASNVESNVHQATRSAMKAAGMSPSPANVQERMEDRVSAVSSAASSVYSDVSEVVTSGYSAATEAVSEIPTVVSETVALLRSSASEAGERVSSGVHSATRAAAKAVGATPSPESAEEYVEAVKEGVKEAAKSVVSGVEKATDRVKTAVKDEL